MFDGRIGKGVVRVCSKRRRLLPENPEAKRIAHKVTIIKVNGAPKQGIVPKMIMRY